MIRATRHTPGPWHFEKKAGRILIVNRDGFAPAMIPFADPQGVADADLIAAAPELLEAARAAAKSHMMYGKVMQRDIDALVAAIHKAQGGAA